MHVRSGRANQLRRALPLVASLLASDAAAGDWHMGGTLACSDCHTMHNAMNGQPMRYDASPTPANQLLRAENATALCLACHGGTSPTSHAPNVMIASNGDPPGGGFATDPLAHTAHTLDPTPVHPPDGTTEVVLTCVTCHAPHGSTGYRNLRASPSGSGRSSAAPLVVQGAAANGTNTSLVYVRSNVRYVTGTSAWCLDCHDTLTTAHTEEEHPWDVPISGSDPATWAAWSVDPMENRVPVERPGTVAFTEPFVPAPTDRVTCLSCHKAHGSPNPSALIYADGVALSSTCQQCHNQ